MMLQLSPRWPLYLLGSLILLLSLVTIVGERGALHLWRLGGEKSRIDEQNYRMQSDNEMLAAKGFPRPSRQLLSGKIGARGTQHGAPRRGGLPLFQSRVAPHPQRRQPGFRTTPVKGTQTSVSVRLDSPRSQAHSHPTLNFRQITRSHNDPPDFSMSGGSTNNKYRDYAEIIRIRPCL